MGLIGVGRIACDVVAAHAVVISGAGCESGIVIVVVVGRSARSIRSPYSTVFLSLDAESSFIVGVILPGEVDLA